MIGIGEVKKQIILLEQGGKKKMLFCFTMLWKFVQWQWQKRQDWQWQRSGDKKEKPGHWKLAMGNNKRKVTCSRESVTIASGDTNEKDGHWQLLQVVIKTESSNPVNWLHKVVWITSFSSPGVKFKYKKWKYKCEFNQNSPVQGWSPGWGGKSWCWSSQRANSP